MSQVTKVILAQAFCFLLLVSIAQDKPWSYEIKVDTKFKIDSVLAEQWQDWEVHANKYDKSMHFEIMSDSGGITTIGWSWLKSLDRHNVVVDTLTYPPIKPYPPLHIYNLFVVDDSTISITRRGRSELVGYKNGNLSPKGGFTPDPKDKTYKKMANWLSFSSVKDTIVVIKEKKNTWSFNHFRNGKLTKFYESCETSSGWQFPFHSSMTQGASINNKGFTATVADCGQFISFDFSTKKLTSYILPLSTADFGEPLLHVDRVTGIPFLVRNVQSTKSLWQIIEARFENGEIKSTKKIYYTTIPNLHSIQNISNHKLHVVGFSGGDIVHFHAPIEELNTPEDLREKAARLDEVTVEDNDH